MITTNSQIKVTKRVHPSYIETKTMNKKMGLVNARHVRHFEGKYQYIFESNKGKISMIELMNAFYAETNQIWEIYCLEGDLFEDIERFPTRREAKKRIMELLQ